MKGLGVIRAGSSKRNLKNSERKQNIASCSGKKLNK